MYTGMPRLAPEQEEEVAAAIRTRLEILRPAAAYGTASCDSDILCLEALGRLGETHIVLPFPAEDLRRLRIDLSRGEWGERFERVLAAANSVTVTSDHRARGSAATFEYASLVVTGMARLRARLLLRTDLRGISIGGGGPTASDGGASSLLRIWRSQDVDIEQVPTVAPRRDAAESTGGAAPASGAAIPADEEVVGLGERLPDGFAHEIRAMLFADAVGYSALSEDQTPNFVTQFLGAVADLNARSAQRPEHVETTGDGLYMVFGSVRDAGDYALQLNRLVSGTDWAARGLPGGLSIRIALHCGPVYCGHNPLTGAPLYTGPHTSRTARIEPITPPGQVYASSAFAAVAAATGVEGLEMRYVGRMPLAKGYGLLGLYHVPFLSRRIKRGLLRRNRSVIACIICRANRGVTSTSRRNRFSLIAPMLAIGGRNRSGAARLPVDESHLAEHAAGIDASSHGARPADRFRRAPSTTADIPQSAGSPALKIVSPCLKDRISVS